MRAKEGSGTSRYSAVWSSTSTPSWVGLKWVSSEEGGGTWHGGGGGSG